MSVDERRFVRWGYLMSILIFFERGAGSDLGLGFYLLSGGYAMVIL